MHKTYITLYLCRFTAGTTRMESSINWQLATGQRTWTQSSYVRQLVRLCIAHICAYMILIGRVILPEQYLCGSGRGSHWGGGQSDVCAQNSLGSSVDWLICISVDSFYTSNMVELNTARHMGCADQPPSPSQPCYRLPCSWIFGHRKSRRPPIETIGDPHHTLGYIPDRLRCMVPLSALTI